ncbi:GTPase [Aeromonas veronii]|uniref:GTPase n=1 Tax=Aeromonas veronii TaxID=654 RepID=UPI003D245924
MTETQLYDLFSRANELLRHDAGGEKPVVAAWGLMNAGKSYLLNMLTDHIQTECFRTRDVRETAELKQFETSSYIFLDTPGLDANQDDDAIAHQGAAKADVVLFVHQPQGEFEKIEVDFLRSLKASFGEYAEQNIILILSKVDSEDAAKIDAIEKRMLEQCQKELNFQPRCFQISGIRFHNGVQQNIEGLVRASHMQELKVHLNTLKVDSHSVKYARQRLALDEMIAEIERAEQTVLQTKIATENALARDFVPFNRAIATLSEALNNKTNDYHSLS